MSDEQGSSRPGGDGTRGVGGAIAALAVNRAIVFEKVGSPPDRPANV